MNEIEFCTKCKTDTDHNVEYKTMSDGRNMRQGVCSACGIKRALPQSIKKPGEMIIYFGKHKGSKYSDLPIEYIQWLISGECEQVNKAMQTRLTSVLCEKDLNNAPDPLA